MLNDEKRGVGVSLTAEKVDTLACQLREVRVTRTNAPEGPLQERAAALAARVTGLLEPLRLLEVDDERGAALLRSESPAKHGTDLRYYEVTLKRDGSASVTRYQSSRGASKRQQTPFALTHEGLTKLVRDLCA